MRANHSRKRLEKVLKSDRLNAEDAFIRAVTRDVNNVLSEYFQIVDGSLQSMITPLPKEGCEVEIKLKAYRLKNVKIIE